MTFLKMKKRIFLDLALMKGMSRYFSATCFTEVFSCSDTFKSAENSEVVRLVMKQVRVCNKDFQTAHIRWKFVDSVMCNSPLKLCICISITMVRTKGCSKYKMSPTCGRYFVPFQIDTGH